ncbi:hypothetical protein KC333_g5552 [Hortaea werneckii]|nr:hypothetical protein KC333_g5552 [Hortaea werneckii]KAI7308711.1 hypothetical protein KC326_g7315 [Hortaea werneckii]
MKSAASELVILLASQSPSFCKTKSEPLDMEQLEALLHQTRKDERSPSWAADVQQTCRESWLALATDKVKVNMQHQLITLLQNEDAFNLARMVIPELSMALDNQLSCPRQQTVLDSTYTLREKIASYTSRTQDTFDDELYRAEKDIFMEAEVLRASWLLHQHRALGAADVGEIRRWLEDRPGRG